MLPINKKISSYNYSSRSGNSVKYLVIHYTGNKGDTAKNNIDYFYGGDRSASAHYFVDDTSIWQSVEESNAAWAVGGGTSYGPTNRNSISIEMCCGKDGQVTSTTEANTLELTKYLMSKYNISASNVVRHYDCNTIRKICPNWSANNWERWSNFKANLIKDSNSSNATTTVVTSTEKSLLQKAKEFVGSRCKELQEKLIKLGYNCGGYGADGQFGQGTLDSLMAFQRDNGLTVDGLAGSATFSKLDQLIASKTSTTSSAKANVKKIQTLCNTVLKSGLVVDGVWGTKTETAVKKLPLCGLPYVQRECTKFVQEVLGISVDGVFGNATASAVKSFQKSKGLDQDGIVGFNSYKALANK